MPTRATVKVPAQDPVQSAKDAGLRYVNGNTNRGIHRKRAGKGFSYSNGDGKAIHDKQTLSRIRSLVIPPAWQNVWICPIPNGHIQAIGVDARGRKQYRYHPRWRETRDGTKYEKMLAFARALPKIRRRTSRDLRRKGMPREKILAAVVRLLETTLIRVGNDEYARDNKHYGLTTIHNKHVSVRGASIHFEFQGKSGVDHDIDLEDQRLARIVKRCQDLPGQELFGYKDEEGNVHDVTSEDVNAYLQKIAGDAFTAKDFRTWAGTVLAAKALQEFEEFDSKAAAKKNVVRAIESVAQKLGNTKAVCRKCYVHPAILDAYMDGTLLKTLKQRAEAQLQRLGNLSAEEGAVLAFLEKRLARESRR